MRSKKILIVEDQYLISLELENRLNELGYSVAGICESAEKAINFLCNNKVELVLLDIYLKGKIDGIDAAKIIVNKFDLPIIYITAYSDESIINRAIDTNVYGYIIKPVNIKELKANIEMALKKHKQVNKKNNVMRNKKIQIWVGQELINIEPNDVVYIEIDSGQVCFYLEDDKYCQRGTLKDWQRKLNAYDFIRCHRSYLVNIKKITGIILERKGVYSLNLEGAKSKIPLSREKYQNIKNQIGI